MFPERTELLLIGCLIESIWTRRSKSNTLTPRTNSQTYWQREISHVMNGIIFCVCSRSAISVPLMHVNLKAMSKRTQEDACEERVTAKSKPMMKFGITIPCKGSERACFDCIRKPGENQSESQNVPLSSFHVQQTSTEWPVLGASSSNYSEWNIDGKWSGLLKCGNVVKCRTQVRRDPSLTSLSSMMIWTLTPPQNRTFLLDHDHSWTGWMIDFERSWTNLQKMQCKTLTNVLWFGKRLCLRHWKHRCSWERIAQTICIPPKNTGKISIWSRCSRYLRNW